MVDYPDIPIWGQLFVYNTPSESLKSLSREEVDDYLVRLVKVASSRELRKMLVRGK